MSRSQRSARPLLILPPLVVGILAVVWFVASREPPALAPESEPRRTVRVVETALEDIVPEVEGYGTVAPARVWAAIAQVPGRVVSLRTGLRNGANVPAGATLLRIDPVDYELAIEQAQAELAELEVEASNAERSLAIEQRNLELAEREAARQRDLAERGTASRLAVDDAERAVLASLAAAQNLRNTLALVPTRRRRLEAEIARARRDLARTEIKAPFALRVASLSVEVDQYVSAGERLLEGDDVARVEVVARFPMARLRRLLIGREGLSLDADRRDPQLQRLVDLQPQVSLDLGDVTARWDAELVGFSDQVDAETRTVGIEVAVDDPFGKAIPGERPPLTKGMFVEVRLRGPAAGPFIRVPRSAVRNGHVYVADESDRLRRRQVEVLFSQGSASVLGSGVAAGERVVVSDIVPAVEGMLLDTIVEPSTSGDGDPGR